MRPVILLGSGFVGATPASVLTVSNIPQHKQAVVEKKNKAKPKAKKHVKKCH